MNLQYAFYACPASSPSVFMLCKCSPVEKLAAEYHTALVQGLARPIWQIMSSGMDKSTASGLDTSCGDACCGFVKDNAGLRGKGKACHVYGKPNIGMLEFDWLRNTITLSIVAGDTGGIAIGADGAPLQVSISMETCEAVEG